MTQDDEVARRGQTTPLFRIHWRTGSTGPVSQSTGLYAHDIAEMWVLSLNADKDNRALGLVYWAEPAADEPNGVERGPVVR